MPPRTRTGSARLDVPWARSRLGVALRAFLLRGVFRPLCALYTRRRVTGRELLEALDGPVVLVATHASHMDTPLLLAALPPALRRRTVVAAAADYFYTSRLLAEAVSVTFGTVPIERHGGGLKPAGVGPLPQLLDDGWSVVVFAEGTRSRDGSVGRLRSGAAVLAAEHDLPIVPVRVTGTHEAMPPGQGWPRLVRRSWLVRRRHPVGVRFGTPVHIQPGEGRREVMERVRAELGARSDGRFTREPAVSHLTADAPDA